MLNVFVLIVCIWTVYYIIMINAINLAGMVWLSYTVGHPTDVAELLSMGKTPTCLVMRNEVLEASNPREKHESFPFIRRRLRSLKTISQDLSRQSQRTCTD